MSQVPSYKLEACDMGLETIMNKKHLDVVAALIIESGKMLLCQRKADDHYPLYWEFPGGCIEMGETQEQAMEREIDEELGIQVKAFKRLAEFEDEDASLHITVYLLQCEILKGNPYARDCKAWAWLNCAQSADLNLGPVDRKILSYVRDSHLFGRL